MKLLQISLSCLFYLGCTIVHAIIVLQFVEFIFLLLLLTVTAPHSKNYMFLLFLLELSFLQFVIAFIVVNDEMYDWYDFALSEDATIISVVVKNGPIFVSNDEGFTWSRSENEGWKNWQSITSSSDGKNLTAVEMSGYIYTSIDGVALWTTHDDYSNWKCVASSADGSILFAGAERMYVSKDGGNTWQDETGVWDFLCCACSYDGMRAIAGTLFGDICLSDDAFDHEDCRGLDVIKYKEWTEMVMSANGSVIVGSFQDVYKSEDYGYTWTLLDLPNSHWASLAISSDGTKIVAAEKSGYVWISEDGGKVFNRMLSLDYRNWGSVAISSDGTFLLAAVQNGYIYADFNCSTDHYMSSSGCAACAA